MRIAFFGTPDFAVPTLDALVSEHEVALVVAQPDKPVGRGLTMTPPPVARRARELNVPLLQPARIRDPQFLDEFQKLAVDVAIVVAYGKILPANLLAIPRHGFLNVHASLLPRYRGAAPIQRAIEAGDTATGVTIMRIDEQLDHGPMLDVAETPIGPHEHTPALAARLAALGGASMAGVLRALDDGTAAEVEQDHAAATYAAKIEKQEGEIDWQQSARRIYDRFRAFDPWPGVFTKSGIKLMEMRPAQQQGEAGTILSIDSAGVIVGTGEGSLQLITIQRPGKGRAAAADVVRGLGLGTGNTLP